MSIKNHISTLQLIAILLVIQIFMKLLLWIANESISRLHLSIFFDINIIWLSFYFIQNLLFYFTTLYYFTLIIFNFVVKVDIVVIYYLMI